ncbi:TetR/AcrR family transcriptional regulator [Mycolicibacterium moriokaense]|uniref:HTH tetR-type domain-containing protein n=1 Tax=Mycolicibacterium moriokaense TaxID=39691 RepID=A0AAD1H8R1_9MYCO|nr:TetR/AcrR family transcriptional regulator [Mycolicibacterium moriokaense]MCV7039194.1 TetR/AcrR family transcriptional regulator [Mycolicibacterium moriokaense]BBX00099.1 hypothetical protein MMOR_10350 [Mycolicibacterium moriokaense]
MTAVPPVRRPRKSSAELRELLTAAARTTFSERGFAGATTRDIAELAGTSETVLFRHFGSKAGLFDASIIEPFSSFIRRFVDTWLAVEEPHEAEIPTRAFFAEMYQMLREQRGVLLTLMAADVHEPDVAVNADIALFLDRIEAVAARELELRGWHAVDIPVLVRIAFGMVLAAAVFKEWLYTEPDSVPDDHIIDEMVEILISGASGSRAQSASSGCVVTEHRDRWRVDFRGAAQPVLLREAAEWLARSGRTVESMSWHNGELRLYY